jgi:hypothetical protein
LSEARQRDQWQHTSQVLCLLANAHRNPEKRPSIYQPWEFDPFELRDREPVQQHVSWSTFEKLCGLEPDEGEEAE